MDESAFYLLPGLVRTYAPRGETPVLRLPLTRDHLAAISGITKDGRLFLRETSPPLPAPGLVFAHPRAIRGHLPDAAALQLLLAGCRLLTSFGAGETRGLGWSEVDAVARVDGAPVVFEPNLLLAERS